MNHQKETFKLIGLKLSHKTTNQNNQSSSDCGNLWQKFETDDVFNAIPAKISNEIFAVYFEYEKDETAPFSYFIGCKVTEDTPVPQGLEALAIPAQYYKKITAKGVMTGCITDAWKDIWASQIKRKFAYDFEVYDERSRDWNAAEVDIFVSVME